MGEDKKNMGNMTPLTDDELDKVTAGFNLFKWISELLGKTTDAPTVPMDKHDVRKCGLTRPDVKNNGLDSTNS